MHTPATLAEIVPDKGYPLSVYCRFVGCHIETARKRCDAGLIPTRPRIGAHRSVSGATILAHCGHAEPPDRGETKAERERRAREALARINAGRRTKKPATA